MMMNWHYTNFHSLITKVCAMLWKSEARNLSCIVGSQISKFGTLRVLVFSICWDWKILVGKKNIKLATVYYDFILILFPWKKNANSLLNNWLLLCVLRLWGNLKLCVSEWLRDRAWPRRARRLSSLIFCWESPGCGALSWGNNNHFLSQLFSLPN